MDVQAKKLALIKWITQLRDASIIQQIDRIRAKSYAGNESEPMTLEEFLVRNRQSQEDIQTGRVMAQEVIVTDIFHTKRSPRKMRRGK